MVFNDKKGFRGLGNLVSDISEDIATQPSDEFLNEVATENQSTSGSLDTIGQPKPTKPQQGNNTSSNVAAPEIGKPSGNSVVAWGLGIAAVITLLIVFSSNDNKSSSNYSPSYSAPTPAIQAPVQSEPISPSFEVKKPSVGQNQVLGSKEIRYCILEKMRLDAIEVILNNSQSSEVRQFNDRIADYNSRCSSFRYRRGELERIQSEINRHAGEIAKKARLDWADRVLTKTDATKHNVAPKAPQKRPSDNKIPKCVNGDRCQGDALNKSGFKKEGSVCSTSFECDVGMDCYSSVCKTRSVRSYPVITTNTKSNMEGVYKKEGAVCSSNFECDVGMDCVASLCELRSRHGDAGVSPSPKYPQESAFKKSGSVCSNNFECDVGMDCISSVCKARKTEPPDIERNSSGFKKAGASCSNNFQCDVGMDCVGGACSKR